MTIALVGAMILGARGASRAAEPTAFDLVRRGDQFVGIQSKDQVVQIHSEKSVGGLAPNRWYIVYHDPDAMFKAVQVGFNSGAETAVTHPMRLMAMFKGGRKTLDPAGLRVDSDQAIRLATAQPLLASLKLTATQLSLDNGQNGPEWHVAIWATRPNKPEEDVSLGSVSLSAKDGSVMNVDLRPANVD